MTKKSVENPQPFLKWAGGKRALIPEIVPRIPNFNGRYIEAFLGAGAIAFTQDSKKLKLLNDFNPDLVEVYEVIRDKPQALLQKLKSFNNTQEFFLEIRAWDRDPNYRKLHNKIERAARFIYLNKTGFNGLYRVNSKGFFNVPYGHSKNPDFIAEANIEAVSKYLNASVEGVTATTLMSGDYRKATSLARPGDFVYLDPPYDPISETASFVAYQSTGFTPKDQEDLRDEVVRLTELEIPVLLSNSSTPLINELYGLDIFHIDFVDVKRVISAKASARGTIKEVLVNNFKAVGVG